jgi:coenzyme F420 hydrogenase subunit beta
LRPKPFIAKTKEEILLAAQSKYCPVPVNIGLNEISKTPGRYAIVGLPCHIQGARKAAWNNATLRDRLVLYLGLACNHQPTFRATEYLLKRIGVPENQVDKIEYRSKGWPGKMTITLKDGRKKLVDHFSLPYWGGAFSDFFYLARCIICEDKLSEYADLSFMDAWLPEFSEKRMCESISVSRTQTGEKLLQSAISENVISVFEIPVEKVIASQSVISSKRRSSARARLLQQSHRAIPISRKALLSASPVDYVKALSMPLRMYISEKPSLWFIVDLYLLLSRSRRSSLARASYLQEQ